MGFSPAKLDSSLARKSALRLVALLEFLKGIFVLCIGIAALLLVHKDAWYYAERLLAFLHVNPDRRYAELFLDFADRLTDASLWAAAWLAFVYACLRFVEGYGLWRQRTWAEWVAFLSGMLLLPLEIHSLMRGITLVRTAIFIGNIAIILYMWFLIRSGKAPAVVTAGPGNKHTGAVIPDSDHLS
jgi:uncharacterized membrane protein (DUF2068 family)